jgi:hypothetical protein
MRLLIFGLCALLLAVPACKRKRHVNPAATIEEEAELESVISVAEPAVASQILHGFHAVEGNAWRWSMRTFAVTLRPPDGSGATGAQLEMEYALPEAVAPRMDGVAISASIDGKPLPPVRSRGQGSLKYTQAVPAALLNGKDGVIVEFTLDKVLEPGTIDSRELGLVVSRIGFIRK